MCVCGVEGDPNDPEFARIHQEHVMLAGLDKRQAREVRLQKASATVPSGKILSLSPGRHRALKPSALERKATPRDADRFSPRF